MQKINLKHLNNFFSNLFILFPKMSALLSGALAKFCFCKGITFPILILPMFGILLFILKNTNLKKSFSIGFFFGLGYFGSSLYWIAESFKCVGFGNYGYIAVLFLVLYLSIYPAIVCYLTKLLGNTNSSFMLFFAVFWVLAEYARGVIFTGFPWNLIGYIAYDIPYFAQIADIFGIYGVSFILLLTTVFLFNKKTFIYGMAIFIITILYGCYKINIYDNYIIPNEQYNVKIVQPSIRQEDKMNPAKFKEHLHRHLALSDISSGIYRGKTLIIWPEAAINNPLQSNILDYIGSFIQYPDTYILTGCDRIDENERLYNSAYMIGKSGKILQTYDKKHLLPFGEFIPEFLLKLGIKKLTSGITNFSRGALPRTIRTKEFGGFDIVICYEIAFPGEILENEKSNWILNITNDSWFKDSDGPTQHLKIACFRAIEEGKPIIRCANNGISAVIDCNGKILKFLNTDEIGKIDTLMPQKQQKTLFSHYKNSIIFTIILLLIAILLIKRKSKFLA